MGIKNKSTDPHPHSIHKNLESKIQDLFLPKQLILQPIRQPLMRIMLLLLLLLRRLIQVHITLTTALC